MGISLETPFNELLSAYFPCADDKTTAACSPVMRTAAVVMDSPLQGEDDARDPVRDHDLHAVQPVKTGRIVHSSTGGVEGHARQCGPADTVNASKLGVNRMTDAPLDAKAGNAQGAGIKPGPVDSPQNSDVELQRDCSVACRRDNSKPDSFTSVTTSGAGEGNGLNAEGSKTTDGRAGNLSRAKATEGKAGMAGGQAPVRGSTAGTGLRVDEASADLPATSEFMDATAGETAPNSQFGPRPPSEGSGSGSSVLQIVAETEQRDNSGKPVRAQRGLVKAGDHNDRQDAARFNSRSGTEGRAGTSEQAYPVDRVHGHNQQQKTGLVGIESDLRDATPSPVISFGPGNLAAVSSASLKIVADFITSSCSSAESRRSAAPTQPRISASGYPALSRFDQTGAGLASGLQDEFPLPVSRETGEANGLSAWRSWLLEWRALAGMGTKKRSRGYAHATYHVLHPRTLEDIMFDVEVGIGDVVDEIKAGRMRLSNLNQSDAIISRGVA